jgi:type VI secretion system protein ImpC
MSLDRFRVELSADPDRATHRLEPLDDHPLQIVIAGDFRGAEGDASEASAEIGPLVSVDPETLDTVIARLAPRVSLRLDDGAEIELTIRELEDFHPDRLLDQVPYLAALRAARSRASDSSESLTTLRAAAGLPDEVAKPARASVKPRAAPKPPAGSMLDWILDDQASSERAPSELDQFVNEVVAPHLVQEPDESRAALISELDSALTTRVRRILHHPRFQALEALWRGTALLLQRLEVGPSLRVHVLQATRSGLLADSRVGADPGRSELGRALRALPRGNGPALVVVDLAFDANDEDLEVLTALARTAHEHEAIVIGASAPGLAGLDGRGEPEGPWDVQPWSDPAWLAFRKSAQSDNVLLALPRIMLRPPYGEDGESCQKLDFEETAVPPTRAEYLWGNPGFACAVLLGQAVAASGWPLRLPDPPEVTGLPVHSWRDGERSGLVHCTEWVARSDVAGALSKSGLTVFMTSGHGDVARLMKFRTLGLDA